eukprot:CAMPEP_0117078572 /NCGR_PEP_ID=MMETSP0472-20121206/55412_1 /TAXON_ID=693140 ORGANISM="Tiarina fusus, Strain LIS" /NCGR_SAMPLE_ID=MMETSP0472 /ASSEMBLY_ACC=CAM_ASM_000603 /LENGTH=793 /DNA_ID=CAMNT_0004805395 /DNA_START=184 /DNA_END=2565 /DNA_ORIENTATION=+
MHFTTALRASLFCLLAPNVGALTKSTSLDEPFQDAFKNLEHSGCVTLYHRNGRSGCGTLDRETQSGPLYYYDGSSSLPAQDFVAVIEEYQLSAETISGILAGGSSYLKGILVLNSTNSNDDGEYSSPGPIYPLGYTTPSADISYGNIQFPWNGNGDGLNQYDVYGVPIVYINNEDPSDYVRDAAQDEEKAVSIYTEFNYYMGPDGVQSKECLAWQDAGDNMWNPKCLPLGGTSVWAFAGSPPKSNTADVNNNSNNDGNGDERRLEDAADNNGNGGNSYSNRKSSILVAVSTDTTSMFHDLAPGANEGASNILTLLMAAYLLGQSITDATLDALPKRIVFGFFEGEAYGYLGSRSFLSDIMGFKCKSKYLVHSVSGDENSDKACLYPLRPSLKFKDLGRIAGMLTVDQVGVPAGEGQLYVHNDGSGGIGTFLANVLKQSSTQYYSAVASAAEGDGDFPYPPTPLTSLLALTGGQYGGAVLSGYDYAFTKRPPYQSHLNSVVDTQMNLKAIASAATIVARAALAAAYDDGSGDYETSAEYAADVIGELSSSNEILLELADCLFVDGNCKKLKKYAAMEAANERSRTGIDISEGASLGSPPNFYTGVYNINSGQPFVRVGDKYYGAYNGENYGSRSSDAFGVQADMLEQALRNMLNDFLGRGAFQDQYGDSISPSSCSKHSDCNGISYCKSTGDSATCSASKVCVCNRAYYHQALDEALVPAVNNYTGYFEVSSSDAGLSPMWTEPYWSSDVGVRMYRVAKSNPGYITLVFGGISLALCFFIAVLVKVGMRKVKVY